jgi:hypothetical protein
MNIRWILFLSLLALALGSCGGSSQAGGKQSPNLPLTASTKDPPSTPLPAQSIQGENTQMNPSLSTPSAFGLEGLIEKAKEDLAKRLSVSVDQISLVEAVSTVWPDSSMGCAQPGMKYLQIPEDGALIVLEVEGVSYEYHNGGKHGLFLCEKKFKNPSLPPKIDIFNLTPSKSNTSSTPDNSIPPGEDK